MGEGTKRAKAKDYRQKRSEVPLEETVQESIFGGMVAVISNEFICYFNDVEAWPQLDAKIQLVDFKRSHVEVIYGVRIIGYVLDEGSALLRGQFQIGARRGSIIPGVITEINKDWGEFTVRLST
jgi:hypothetical protein